VVQPAEGIICEGKRRDATAVADCDEGARRSWPGVLSERRCERCSRRSMDKADALNYSERWFLDASGGKEWVFRVFICVRVCVCVLGNEYIDPESKVALESEI